MPRAPSISCASTPTILEQHQLAHRPSGTCSTKLVLFTSLLEMQAWHEVAPSCVSRTPHLQARARGPERGRGGRLSPAAGQRRAQRPHPTIGQILRANLLTRFNLLLGSLLAVIPVVGPLQDALFGLVIVANTVVGVVQEVRAKRTLDCPRWSTPPGPGGPRRAGGRAGRRSGRARRRARGRRRRPAGGRRRGAGGTGWRSTSRCSPASPELQVPDARRPAAVGQLRGRRQRPLLATKVGRGLRGPALRGGLPLHPGPLRAAGLGVDQILKYVTWALVPTAVLLFYSSSAAAGPRDPGQAGAGPWPAPWPWSPRAWSC